MFDNHSLTIDNNCSFHIHLSVDGVKHVYGQQTQAEMSAYLLKNIDEFPKSVQDRLRTDATRWCEPRVSTEKYTFINYNADFGTWEFRLWGNINNYQDAKKALFLSIRALKHAYRVKTGISKPILRKTEYSHLNLIMREGLKRITLRAVRLKNKYLWNLIKQAA
jgi:hemolysin activation/secretion protein